MSYLANKLPNTCDVQKLGFRNEQKRVNYVSLWMHSYLLIHHTWMEVTNQAVSFENLRREKQKWWDLPSPCVECVGLIWLVYITIILLGGRTEDNIKGSNACIHSMAMGGKNSGTERRTTSHILWQFSEGRPNRPLLNFHMFININNTSWGQHVQGTCLPLYLIVT